MKKMKKGFTLVEIMIVVAIIAIQRVLAGVTSWVLISTLRFRRPALPRDRIPIPFLRMTRRILRAAIRKPKLSTRMLCRLRLDRKRT